MVFPSAYNEQTQLLPEEGVDMKKVMIATLFSPDAVLLAAHKIGPERLFLLINDDPIKEQQNSLKLLESSLGRVIEIKTVKISVYDIVKIATQMARKNKLKSISKIVVRLGKIEAHGEEIQPENLRFNFELVKRNTFAEKALLLIQKGRGEELSIVEVQGER